MGCSQPLDLCRIFGLFCSTATPTHTPTNTPLPTATPTHTLTNTPLPTDTPTHTPTNTPLPTDTPTHTPLPTDTPTPTNTPLPTATPTHTPTLTLEVGAAPYITSFILVNADADEDLRPLSDGDTIIEGTFTIRVETTPATVGSVVFGLNDNPRFKVENQDAYALRGDNSGDYHAWLAEPGTYKLTATPYTEADGQGEAGTPLTITFTVVAASS